MAVDNRNIISTWSILTGKLESQTKLTNIDLSNYKIHSFSNQDVTYINEWYLPYTLIMKYAPEEGWDDI